MLLEMNARVGHSSKEPAGTSPPGKSSTDRLFMNILSREAHLSYGRCMSYLQKAKIVLLLRKRLCVCT